MPYIDYTFPPTVGTKGEGARWEPREGWGERVGGWSTVDGREKQMLKRQGARCTIPQRGKRHCPPTRSERQLPADVQAFLIATDAGTRELRALQHFALAGHRPHPTCQICQTAIRARLQRRSLQRRAQGGAHSADPDVAQPVAGAAQVL